ncbi:tetratricopeptide repeat protein [Magnetospirillum molischianum]|uniref:FOG: TPR repeat n=1 Tax=Magnetospirillum molischianum DSM 120 TaxID=1150626 RepID=H8FU92_MAGML|nr:tetratricopeptide repeat protein [Magnetospirillum molischianum]CCG41930.1 FOG: TPR repeat [Magnetospirillum molischianum DSM 120]
MGNIPEIDAKERYESALTALKAGDLTRAENELAQLVRLDPNRAVAHGDLGVLLRRRGLPAAAAACYRRSLALAPDRAATLSNLGNALRELGRLDEAEVALSRAVELEPDSVGFRYNLALLLRDRRRPEEALAMMEPLLELQPGNAEIEWDIALTRLYLDDFHRGFAGYEARERLPRTLHRVFPGERWRGGSVAGRTVLLVSEQGFGDALQFVRFVPMLSRLGARVVLECLPELSELFGTLPGLAAVIAKGDAPPPYDLWAPMASLPHLLRVGVADLPGPCPYLTAPPRSGPQLPLPQGVRRTAGLVWAGKTNPRDRSWPLEALVPLLSDPSIGWVSLQHGPRGADLTRLGIDRLVIDAVPALTSFADTAALMARLDLIVTIDTAAAHLAGALGRPAYVLLRHVSDWRWGDVRDDSPWYPTLRLFRQSDPDDYAGPVVRIAKALTGHG